MKSDVYFCIYEKDAELTDKHLKLIEQQTIGSEELRGDMFDNDVLNVYRGALVGVIEHKKYRGYLRHEQNS